MLKIKSMHNHIAGRSFAALRMTGGVLSRLEFLRRLRRRKNSPVSFLRVLSSRTQRSEERDLLATNVLYANNNKAFSLNLMTLGANPRVRPYMALHPHIKKRAVASPALPKQQTK